MIYLFLVQLKAQIEIETDELGTIVLTTFFTLLIDVQEIVLVANECVHVDNRK